MRHPHILREEVLDARRLAGADKEPCPRVKFGVAVRHALMLPEMFRPRLDCEFLDEACRIGKILRQTPAHRAVTKAVQLSSLGMRILRPGCGVCAAAGNAIVMTAMAVVNHIFESVTRWMIHLAGGMG